MQRHRLIGLVAGHLYTTLGLTIALYYSLHDSILLTGTGAFMVWSGYLLTHYIENDRLTDIDRGFTFTMDDLTLATATGLITGGIMLLGALNGIGTTLQTGNIAELWMYGIIGAAGYSIIHYITSETFV